MIPLIVIAAVLLLLALLLFLPLCLEIRYSDRLCIIIRFAGIKLYDSTKNKKTGNTEGPDDKSVVKKQTQGTLHRLSEKLGFGGAVSELFVFLKTVLSKIRHSLKHVKINRLVLDISVATENAAKTAVTYGTVCTAVYPVIALLEDCTTVKFKQVSLRADFNAAKPFFSGSGTVSLAPIHIIIAAVAVFNEYKKFKTRNEL